MLQTPIRKRKANEVLRVKLLGSQQVSPKEEGAYAAARKCFQAVSSRRKELEREVQQLRSAVVHLKDEILKHAQCGNVTINDYLARMLKQVSGRSMLRLSSLDQTKSRWLRRFLPYLRRRYWAFLGLITCQSMRKGNSKIS
jgi:hypothetical protein